jgi:hypothetical protein
MHSLLLFQNFIQDTILLPYLAVIADIDVCTWIFSLCFCQRYNPNFFGGSGYESLRYLINTGIHYTGNDLVTKHGLT